MRNEFDKKAYAAMVKSVLILILMEYAQWVVILILTKCVREVLILILMEYAQWVYDHLRIAYNQGS